MSASALLRPAEWARHAYTILAWPGAGTAYYRQVPGALARATHDVSAIVDAVARFEPVTLIVGQERLAEAHRRFAPGLHRHKVRVHGIDDDGQQLDLWMRDIAPTFALDERGRLHGVDFGFNGWGGRFPSATCAGLARTLLRDMGTTRVAASLVTEGGALEVDGEGTLLTTESALLNPNRNPGRSRADVEAELRRTLGVEDVVWLPGLRGADSTDGHVDALARFAGRPALVLVSKPVATDGGWARAYDATRAVLARAVDARGRSFDVVEVSEANVDAIEGFDGEYLRALKAGDQEPPVFSYVNYLLVNGGLILPQFGDKAADEAALGIMRRVFGKEREVVPVEIRELPLMGGAIHCSTQEVPYAEKS